MKYIVYKTTNLINNKIYIGVHLTENPDIFDGYIGCGVTGPIKSKKAKKKAKPGFPTAVAKYGYENFKRETLFIYEGNEEGCKAAYKKEAELVNLKFVRDSNTYNLIVGGTHNLQKEVNITTRKTVYQFDLAGNLLKVWKSVTEAANFYSIAHEAISNCCLKKSHQSIGYYWSYKCKFEPMKYNHLSAVAKYNDAGEFIESYTSIKEASEKNSIKTPRNIIAAIQGTQKHCGGFRWRYFYGNTSNIKPLNKFKI